jgi:flagellar motor switch protein FliN
MPDPTPPQGAGQNRLRSVPVEIRVSVGHARPTVAELLDLRQDAVLPLDRRIEDPVELYVGDRLVAYGELLEPDGGGTGALGVRLTELVDGGAG